MKKFLSISLITIMIFLFSGCALNTKYTSKTTNKIKIGVCIYNINDKFQSLMLDAMKNYSNSLNDVEVIFVDSKHDSNIQLSQVQNFISQNVDAIAVNPAVTTNMLTDIAKEAKIPILSYNDPLKNLDDSASYISSDFKQSGILEMEYLAKKMNYKGNVAIMMGGMGSEPQRRRTEAFREVIAKYPDMKIVAEQTAEWNRAKAMALMQTWLESGKEIDVVACSNDEMAIGAIKAIEAAGKLDNITVGGIDATPEALEYLKSGKLAVTVFQDAATLGQCVIETAIKAAKGEKVDKIIKVPNELVTPEDADKYITKWESK